MTGAQFDDEGDKMSIKFLTSLKVVLAYHRKAKIFEILEVGIDTYLGTRVALCVNRSLLIYKMKKVLGIFLLI